MRSVQESSDQLKLLSPRGYRALHNLLYYGRAGSKVRRTLGIRLLTPSLACGLVPGIGLLWASILAREPATKVLSTR
jgi:hypothetical protein